MYYRYRKLCVLLAFTMSMSIALMSQMALAANTGLTTEHLEGPCVCNHW